MFRTIKTKDLLIGDQISIESPTSASCEETIGFTVQGNAVNFRHKGAIFIQIKEVLYVNISKITSMSQLRMILNEKNSQFDNLKLYALFISEIFELPLNSSAIDVSSLKPFNIYNTNIENIGTQDDKEKRKLTDYFQNHETRKRVSFQKVKRLDSLLKR